MTKEIYSGITFRLFLLKLLEFYTLKMRLLLLVQKLFYLGFGTISNGVKE